MCDFETPRLLFYAHVPVIVISFLIGIFILSADRKNPVNKNFAVFVLLFCGWTLINMLPWTVNTAKTTLLLERIGTLIVCSLLFFLFFSYGLVGTSLSKKKKIIFFLPFIPILVFLFSDHNVYMWDYTDCTTANGGLYIYVYFLAIAYTLWSTAVMLKKYFHKDTDKEKKKQIRLVIYAIMILVVWFLIFVIAEEKLMDSPYEWSDQLYLFIPAGMIFFAAIISYAITKYKLLNLKLIAAQILVTALIILIGSQFFFIRNNTNKILNGFTLILALGFGYMLVKSVKLEVQRKEALENLSNQLSVANDKLHELDRAKSEFISIASHQLRTPLTAIKGFVSLLLEGTYGPVAETQRPALEKTYISNERLVQLVEDLLNISRIEAGRMEFDFQMFRLEDIIQEAVDTLALSAKNKGLYLEYKKPEIALSEVRMDGGKMREVISNMIDNAIKYTQKGGVTVKVEKSVNWDAERKEHNGIVRVIVSDTGIGVDPKEIKSIFEKFQRGKGVSHYHTDGTGLGMYVGQKIVAEHHGRIWAESEGVGKGSRFILELPVDSA